MHKRDIGGSNDTVLFQTTYQGWFDVARNQDTLLHTDGGGYTSEYSTLNGFRTQPPNFITGTNGHYSPTDDRILYRMPSDGRGGGYYLMVRQSSGLLTRLTAKGSYAGTDWRPN